MDDNKTYLDKLEKSILELEKASELTGTDLSKEIDAIRKTLEEARAGEKESAVQAVQQAPRDLTAWEKVGLARHRERPNCLEYISNISEKFIELHGDRRFADDKAIIGGVGYIDGRAVTIIGHQKGRNTEENIFRNFGMPNPEGYRKALRLMKQAEKFNRPIITLIDTAGAYCGLGAEERGQAQAIAENLLEMSRLKVPTIAIIIGEGGSGGALALGVADKIAMLENSVYSVISPEGLASILWKDAKRAPDAAAVMNMTSKDLLGLEIIDDIISEPEGGAHNSIKLSAENIKEYIIKSLEELDSHTIEENVEKRYEKIRKMGKYIEL